MGQMYSINVCDITVLYMYICNVEYVIVFETVNVTLCSSAGWLVNIPVCDLF